MRIQSFFLLTVLLSCNTPKVTYSNEGVLANKDAENKILKYLHADTETSSVIVFTDGFLNHEELEVKIENVVVFSDTLSTDRSSGLAKTLKVENSKDITVTNLNIKYKIKLPAKDLIKYKFVYISKDADTDKDYYVDYSHNWKSFY